MDRQKGRTIRKLIAFFMGTLCMLVFTTGCLFFPVEEEAVAPPIVPPTELEFITMPAMRRTIINRIQVKAKFLPIETVSVAFEVRGGILQELNFQTGDIVKKGDLLARFDTKELDDQIRELKWTYDTTRIETERILNSNADAGEKRLAEIELEKAKYYYDEMKKQQEGCAIYAPFDGRIMFKANKPINSAVEKDEMMYRISNEKELALAYSGTDAWRFKVGQTVDIAYDGKSYTGEVTSTESEPSALAMQSEILAKQVIFKVDMPEAYASIGREADVIKVIDIAENVVTIQPNMLQKYLDRQFVYVLEDGNTQVERNVQVGIITDTLVEIVEGLQEGEMVVVR